MRASVEAVVCIPSFRRPEGLRRVLESLTRQQTEIHFAVVVIDNDATGRAGLAVAEAFLPARLEGRALAEPRQGNVHAINAAFASALALYPTARYLLMIDDDEAAEPGWLAAMVAAAQLHRAQIVGGPVHRVFSAPVSPAISRHPLFRSIEAPAGPIDIIHGSGNCLVARAVFERLGAPFFDPAFNFLGGGDMDFFTRARATGFAFAWADEAVVSEFVEAERLTPRWIMARALRTGAINYAIDRKGHPGPAGWTLLALKNTASLGKGLVRFAAALARTRRLLPATHWLLMPLGRIMAAFGWSTSPYRASQPPQGEPQAQLPSH